MISNNSVLIIVIVLIAIAISMTVHEFTHGFVSNMLGDDTAKLSGRLSLNPMKHIDPFATVLLPVVLALLHQPPFGAAKPVPINPAKIRHDEFGAALVGIVGPASNFILALISGGIIRLIGTLNSTLWVTWWYYFIAINVGFCLFNLIPFPPLDGSRVLYAFAPGFLQRIMVQIESFGFFAIIIFILLLFPYIAPTLQALDSRLIGLVIGI